jgi:uncharacterized protein YeaO (DUF488 family)
MKLKIKRVYENPEDTDGFRILVDRIWPRGLSKEKAGIDLWLKEIAPSTELRKSFNHDPKKWNEFKEQYAEELDEKQQELSVIKQQIKKGSVTLVYGAKDELHNQAVVFLEKLQRK